MKSKLLETTEIGEYALFWLGAHATVRHHSAFLLKPNKPLMPKGTPPVEFSLSFLKFQSLSQALSQY